MALPFPVPAALSPAFVMSCPTLADIGAQGNVYLEAFKGDPGISHWWSPDRSAMIEWMNHRIRTKMSDRNVRHFKITDVKTGDLVAWARWDIPENAASFGEWMGDEATMSPDAPQVPQSEKEGTRHAHEFSASAPGVEPVPTTNNFPEGADPNLCKGFFKAISEASAKWYTKDMLGLSLICTDPRYHRRGAAKALLLPMLAKADVQGIRAYVEATPTGKPIYEKLGFRQVDTLDFDLRKLTKVHDEVYSISIMIREPNPTGQRA